MSNSKRIISLTVVCLFVLAAIIVNRAATRAISFTQTPQPPQKSQQEREALAKKPAPSGTLDDRLDKDDGYAIALFYSMGIRGNLEVCGCPIHPLGGVARRTGYINAFRKRSPDAAILQVDAGYIFSDDLNLEGTGLRGDAKLMNDWIVRANEAMGLDIVNLGFHDLLYAGSLLKHDAKLKPEKSFLISANIKSINAGNAGDVGDADRAGPAPYVIKIVTGKRLPQPVRIAIIGLSDVAPDERKDQVTKSGFVIEDPLVAAKAALAEVRDKADVTVIVGYLNLRTANKLAMRNDDLDLIIAADERGIVFDPKQVNNTLVVYAARETKHLGELRFYTDAEGAVERFTARYVELDEIIPDDPRMAEITATARKEIDVVQARLADEEAALIAAKPLITPFALSESCSQCHKAEYEVWKNSRHSHAFTALEEKQRMFDGNCVGCHSLGFRDQGFVSVKATPQFANVHCESCHGPGAEHIKAPTAGNYKTPPKNQSCMVCHDRDNSPDFVFEKYWPVIAHKNSFKPEAAAPLKAPGKTRAGAKRRMRRK